MWALKTEKNKEMEREEQGDEMLQMKIACEREWERNLKEKNGKRPRMKEWYCNEWERKVKRRAMEVKNIEMK